jgi:hypothetical protein
MNAARLRLLLAAVLFAVWIGYLGSLAWATRSPITLSRAQFLVSTLDVVAELEVDPEHPTRPRSQVKILRVHWPESARATLTDAVILVTNLDDCTGWTGQAGAYILPLVKSGPDYRVAAVPPSPGFEGVLLRIYPVRPATEAQLQTIKKPTADKPKSE